MYFQNLSSEYQKYLESKVNESLEKYHITNVAKDNPTDNEKHLIPKKNKIYSISKTDFINLIQSVTNIKTFNYPEKSELLKIWENLKSFDSDILSQVLNDFKLNPDFDNNFIFYLQQLSNLFNKKKYKGAKDYD
jgi:hypothetical protein